MLTPFSTSLMPKAFRILLTERVQAARLSAFTLATGFLSFPKEVYILFRNATFVHSQNSIYSGLIFVNSFFGYLFAHL
jgi:hypothetical protein